MAYCTSADVGNEFKDIVFSSTTAVTDTDVADFITSSDALINAAIAGRYETPVVGPVSVAILKMISIWLVKARILPILSVKTPEDKTKQDPAGPDYYKNAMALLDKIKKGDLKLPDGVLVSGAGGMTSYLKDKTITPEFKVGEDNW